MDESCRSGESSDDRNWNLLLERLANIEEHLAKLTQVPDPHDISDNDLANLATLIYRARQARRRHFSADLFAEPAWDMLLDLVVHHVEGKRVSTTSLCIAANVPQTTALRAVGRLEKQGFVTRIHEPDDRRFTWVDLTPKGYNVMRKCIPEWVVFAKLRQCE